MNAERLAQLTEGWRDGSLTVEEADELSGCLRESPKAREIFRAEARLHGLLHCAVAAQSVQQASTFIARVGELPKSSSRAGWLAWFLRPMRAALGGLILGLCSASVVWALAVQRSEMPTRRIPLLRESFEAGAAPRVAGLPNVPGQWTGDVTEVVSGSASLQPADGKRLLRFRRVDQGRPALKPAISSDAWRIIDLRQVAPQDRPDAMLEMRASLARSSAPATPAEASFALTVVTWSGEASEATEHWQRFQADRMSMAGWATQCVKVDRPGEWVRALLTMPLPKQADFAVVCLSAMPGDAEGNLAGHYADAVEVNIAASAPPLPPKP